MKRLLSVLLSVGMALGLAACAGDPASQTVGESPSGGTDASSAVPASSVVAPESDRETENPAASTLVVVFSATGTTKGVAEKIAAIENAELYEIRAAQPYSAADLDWNDRDSRTTKEQNDASARPEIAGEAISTEGYARIYIGYPIWWGEEPRILDTFVQGRAFGDAQVVPFCTSGGSGIGRSGQNLAALAAGGVWLDGKRFSGSVTEDELRAWISGLQ